jgi:exonuclease SbcC
LIIDNLQLKNIQFIKEASINFQKGFNVIIGENGSGKSSILQDVSYLLYNYVPKTIEDILNWEEDYFETSMKFSHGGKSFFVKSSYDRKSSKTDKLLTIDTTEKINASSLVNEKLASIFDPSLCRAAMVHIQGDNDIVKATPTERRENLKKIYNLDFSSQVSTLEGEIEDIKKKVSTFEKEIYLLENKEYNFKIIPDLSMTEEEYSVIKVEIENLKSELTLLCQKKEEYDANLVKVTKTKNEIIQLESTIDKDSDSIIKTKKIISEAEEVLTIDISSKIDSLKSELLEFSETKKKEISILEEKIASFILSRLPVFPEAELKEKIALRRKSEFSYLSAKKEYEAKLDGKCPTCGKEYSSNDLVEVKALMEEYKSSMDTLEEEIKTLEEKKLALQEKVMEAQKRAQEKEYLVISLTELKNSFDRDLASRQKLIESELTIIEGKKQTLELNKSKLNDLFSRLETSKSFVEEKREIVKELEKKLVGKIEVPSSLIDKITIQEKKIKEYDTTIILISSYKEHNILLAAQQMAEGIKLAEIQVKKDVFLEDIKMWERGVIIFKKELPNFILSRMSKDIEEGMNLFLDKSYNGRYHAKIIETKNGLSIVYGSRDKEISLSSGAEQSLFQLALKIAFTKISGLKILILDEVDCYMSTNIAEAVFKVLAGMIDEGELNQVFIITHNDELKQKFELDFGAKIIELENGKVV